MKAFTKPIVEGAALGRFPQLDPWLGTKGGPRNALGPDVSAEAQRRPGIPNPQEDSAPETMVPQVTQPIQAERTAGGSMAP